jgi:two-component sensor histidine kinase
MYNRLKSYFIGESENIIDSIHDLSRLKLLFNLTVFVTLIASISVVISLILGTYALILPSLVNLIISLITLIILRKTGDFITAAKFYLIFLFLLLFGNLNFNEGTMHIGGPYWIMLINILVLYIIGIRWGIIFISCSLIGYWSYLSYVFPIHLKTIEKLSLEAYFSVYYEVVFALIALGFIIYTMLKSSMRSDLLLKQNNAELLEQNKTILLRDEEKTIMLKEIHHRVKNNLQVITSLLRLQMYEIENVLEAEKFKDSINRVLTMSLIHEKMYQSEELSRINLEEYFTRLSEDLLDSYQTGVDVDLTLNLNIDKVGMKSIVPLALIYNELFSNSLKHAFDGVEKPSIDVRLDQGDDDCFVFVYEDNGIWKSKVRSKTFGTELVSSLTSQLEGKIEFTTSPKTRYKFKFRSLES